MRADLLERAFDLFAQSGYGTVTMRELARWLSVSTGTLYHYFATKEAFFTAMMHHVARRDALTAGAAVPPNAEPLDRARAMHAFVTANEPHLRNLVLLSLDFVRRADPDEQQVIRDGLGGFVEVIERHLRDLPAPVSQPLLAAVIGALVMRILDPDSPVLTDLLGLLPGGA